MKIISAQRSPVAVKKPLPKKDSGKPSSESFSDALKTVRRVALLGDFGDMARRPTISDVEIIVCFADIRGFTRYCNRLQQKSLDNRIQNFLKDYLEIYSLAVLTEVCHLETETKYGKTELRRVIIPTTYKNLGDGVMLIWELPASASKLIQGLASHYILKVLFTIYRLFVSRFHRARNVGVDAYSDEVKELELGFGVARGHAWKLNFGHHVKFDYAGSVVNLAARLSDKARPHGIICQYELSHALFDRFRIKKIGNQLSFNLKGLGKRQAFAFSKREIEALWSKSDIWKEAVE